jgi:single-stranded DNA-binding protein
MKPLKLIGHLGADREIRDTKERTTTVTRWNEVAEMDEEFEVTVPSREYARLSLACQQKVDGRWQTVWHQLVVWDLGRMERFPVRLARKGDRVEVTGHEEPFRFVGEDGVEREIRRIIVHTFRFLQHKVRREAE